MATAGLCESPLFTGRGRNMAGRALELVDEDCEG